MRAAQTLYDASLAESQESEAEPDAADSTPGETAAATDEDFQEAPTLLDGPPVQPDAPTLPDVPGPPADPEAEAAFQQAPTLMSPPSGETPAPGRPGETPAPGRPGDAAQSEDNAATLVQSSNPLVEQSRRFGSDSGLVGSSFGSGSGYGSNFGSGPGAPPPPQGSATFEAPTVIGAPGPAPGSAPGLASGSSSGPMIGPAGTDFAGSSQPTVTELPGEGSASGGASAGASAEFATGAASSLFNSQFTSAELVVGHRLGGWEIQDLLGKGAMGAVYKARRVKDGVEQLAAIKVILPGLSNAEKYLPRFVQEAEVTGKLSHPNVVGFYGYGEDPMPHMALEFIAGSNLRELLKKERRFPVDRTLSIIRPVLEGLEHAHRHGIIHRDLKPDNILMGEDGRPRIADFGLGREDLKEDTPRLTLSGQVMGTPYYMAPEQIESAKSAGVAADLYAVGVMLFHMIAGRPPYTGKQVQILTAHIRKPVPDIRAWAPKVPKELAELIQQLMAKDPAERPPTARAVLEALGSIATEPQPSESTLGSRIVIGPGDRVGDWTIKEELGAGGMGKVFRAERDGQVAALKVMAPTVADDPRARARFEREVKVMIDLSHPNVVRVYDSGVASIKDKDYPFMAMEYAGDDLAAVVETRGALSPAEAVEATLGAAAALQAAHEKGVVHRDVKPENILVAGEDAIRSVDVRLTDFGVAAVSDQSADLTQTTAAVGSPFYMAPEQAKNDDNLDGRADLYSLGATLFFLTTGARLFAADNFQSLLIAHATELPSLASEVTPDVPEELALLIDVAVLKQPGDRPESMEVWSQDLRAWQEGSLSRERVRELKAMARRGRRPFEPRSNLAPIISAVAVLVAAIVVAVVLMRSETVDPWAAIRQELSRGKDELAKLPAEGVPESREVLVRGQAALSRLDELSEEAAESPVAEDFKSLTVALAERIDRKALAFARKQFRDHLDRLKNQQPVPAGTEELADPLSIDLDKTLAEIRPQLTELEGRLGGRPWKRELSDGIGLLRSRMECLRELARISRLITEAQREQRGSYHQTAEVKFKSAAEAFKAFTADWSSKPGHDEIIGLANARGEELKTAAKQNSAEVEALLKQIADLEARYDKAQTREEATKARQAIKDFANEDTTQRNIGALTRALNVLQRDPVKLNLKEELERLDESIKNGTAGEPGKIVERCAEIATNNTDLPEIARLADQVRARAKAELERREAELAKAREAARREALARFTKVREAHAERLAKRLEPDEGLLTRPDFEAMLLAVETFETSETAVPREERRELAERSRVGLEAVRRDYARELERAARKRIIERDEAGRAAFLRRLDRIQRICETAREFLPFLTNREPGEDEAGAGPGDGKPGDDKPADDRPGDQDGEPDPGDGREAGEDKGKDKDEDSAGATPRPLRDGLVEEVATELAWLLEQVAVLRAFHTVDRVVVIPEATIQLGRNEPGFPHHPQVERAVPAVVMDKYEVCVADWRAFLRFNRHFTTGPLEPHRPSVWDKPGAPLPDNEPVRGITWQDARAFARWAGKRLPREDEWELAARGDTGRGPYAWGDALPDASRAAFLRDAPVAVDSLKEGASPYGCLHMTGNVAEWTASPFAPYVEGSNESESEFRGFLAEKVVRGGSCISEPLTLKVWIRGHLPEGQSSPYVGVRCAVDP